MGRPPQRSKKYGRYVSKRNIDASEIASYVGAKQSKTTQRRIYPGKRFKVDTANTAIAESGDEQHKNQLKAKKYSNSATRDFNGVEHVEEFDDEPTTMPVPFKEETSEDDDEDLPLPSKVVRKMPTPFKEETEEMEIARVNEEKNQARLKLANVKVLLNPLVMTEFEGLEKMTASKVTYNINDLKILTPYYTAPWVEHKGYPYYKRAYKKGIDRFLCPKEGCGARLVIRKDNGTLRLTGDHLHPPDSWIPQRNKLYHVLKNRSLSETIPLRTIYDEEAQKYPEGAKHLPYAESTMRLWRNTQGPRDREESQELLEKSNKPQRTIGHKSDVKDICPFRKSPRWIIYKNYPYCQRELTDSGASFRCTRSECTARLFEYSHGDVVREWRCHNHEPDGWVLERNQLYQALKTRSATEVIPLKSIYEEEAKRFPLGAKHLKFPAISMQYWRKKALGSSAGLRELQANVHAKMSACSESRESVPRKADKDWNIEHGNSEPIDDTDKSIVNKETNSSAGTETGKSKKIKAKDYTWNTSLVEVIHPHKSGSTWMVYRDYPYILRGRNPLGPTFRCPRKDCGVRVYVRNVAGMVDLYETHNHPPDTWVRERNELYQVLKKRTISDFDMPLKTIFNEEAKRFPEGAKHLLSLENMSKIRRNVFGVKVKKSKAAQSGVATAAKASGGDTACAIDADTQRGNAASPTSNMAASPKSNMAASPTFDMAASPTSDMAASPTSDMAASPTSDMAASPTPDMEELTSASNSSEDELTYLEDTDSEEAASAKRNDKKTKKNTSKHGRVKKTKGNGIFKQNLAGDKCILQPIASYLRGCEWVMHDGYPYYVRERKPNGISYVCPYDSCRVRLYLRHRTGTIRQYRRHEHPPESWIPQRNALLQELKRRAILETTPLRQIYNEEVENFPIGAKHLPFVESSMRLWRRTASLKVKYEGQADSMDAMQDDSGSMTSNKEHRAKNRTKRVQLTRAKPEDDCRARHTADKSELEVIAPYQLGSSWVMFRNYPFYLRERRPSGKSYKCSYDSCRMRIFVRHSTGGVDEYRRHEHEPQSWIPQRNAMYQELRRRCLEEQTPFLAIYQAEAARFPTGAPHLPYPESSMRSWRRDSPSAVPARLREHSGDSLAMVTHEGRTAVILTSPRFELATETAHALVVDSGFSKLPAVPRVAQVIVLHALVEDRVLCPIIILLEDKTPGLYRAAFAQIMQYIAFSNLTTIYTGYEKALNEELRIAFPAVAIKKYYHYYVQEVLRMAERHGVDPSGGAESALGVCRLLAVALLPRRYLSSGARLACRPAAGAPGLRALHAGYLERWRGQILDKISVYAEPERTGDVIHNFHYKLRRKMNSVHKDRSLCGWWRFLNSVRHVQRNTTPTTKNYECWLEDSVIKSLQRKLQAKYISIDSFLRNAAQRLMELSFLKKFSGQNSQFDFDAKGDDSGLQAVCKDPEDYKPSNSRPALKKASSLSNQSLGCVKTGKFKKQESEEEDEEIDDAFVKTSLYKSQDSIDSALSDAGMDTLSVTDSLMLSDEDNDLPEAEDDSKMKKAIVNSVDCGTDPIGKYSIEGILIANDDEDDCVPIFNTLLSNDEIHSNNRISRATSPKVPKSLLRKCGLIEPISTKNISESLTERKVLELKKSSSNCVVQHSDKTDEVTAQDKNVKHLSPNQAAVKLKTVRIDQTTATEKNLKPLNKQFKILENPIKVDIIQDSSVLPDILPSTGLVRALPTASSSNASTFSVSTKISSAKSATVKPLENLRRVILRPGSASVKAVGSNNSPHLIPVVFKPCVRSTPSKSLAIIKTPTQKPSGTKHQVLSIPVVIRTTLGTKVILSSSNLKNKAKCEVVLPSTDKDTKKNCQACVVSIGEEKCMVCGTKT